MKKKQILILMLLSIANLTPYGPSDGGEAPAPDAGPSLGGSSGEPVDRPGDGYTEEDMADQAIPDDSLNGRLDSRTGNGGYEVPTLRPWQSSSLESITVAPEGSDVALTPGGANNSSQSLMAVADEDDSSLNRSTLTPEQRRAQWGKQYNAENRDENGFATQYNQGYADRYVPKVANEGMSYEPTGDQVSTVQDPASIWASARPPDDESLLNRSTLTPEQRRAQWQKQYDAEKRDENGFPTQYNNRYADLYVPKDANEGMSDQPTDDQDAALVWASARPPQDLQGPEDTQGMVPPDETVDSYNNRKIVITLDPKERMTGLKLKLQSMRRQAERTTNAVKEQVKSTAQKVANKANTLRESMKQSFKDRTAKKQEQARIAKQKAAEEKAEKEKEMQAKKAQLKQRQDKAAAEAKSMSRKEKVTWRDFFKELAFQILNVAAGVPV